MGRFELHYYSRVATLKIKLFISTLILTQAIGVFNLPHLNAQISKITDDGLFLAGYRDIIRQNSLLELQIDSVINVAEELDISSGLAFLSNSLKFPFKDSVKQKILPEFEQISVNIDSLLEDKKRVVVNCQAGRSRSASLILYYLMTRKNMSLAESLDLVIKSRPQIMPNIGFIEQLIEWEINNSGICSLDMNAFVTNLLIQSNRLDLLSKVESAGQNTSVLIQLVKDSGIFFIE